MNRTARVLAVSLVLLLSANIALASNHIRASLRPTWDDDRVLTILVLGSDAGLPRRGNPVNGGRADAIHLVAVDTKELTATIVDIPRDSYIGGRKVTEHLYGGGPQRVKSIMSSYTGIKIDYYALTSFRGLWGLVDGIGGVRIKLDRPIRDTAANANLGGGWQKLSGKEALQFSRARKTVPGGDFARTRHQGNLMRAAHRKLRKDRDLMTITRSVGVFSRNTETDIPPAQLFRLASLALKIKPRNVKQVSLGGGTGFVGSASVVHLNPGSAFSDIRKRRIGP